MKSQTTARDLSWEAPATDAKVLCDESSVLVSDSDAFERVNTTTPTGSTRAAGSAAGVGIAPRVIADVAAVTVGCTPEHVLVKLQGENLTVHFPRELFADNDALAAYGTPLRYQVLERANGFRFQRFQHAPEAVSHDQLSKLDEILDGIKYRTR